NQQISLHRHVSLLPYDARRAAGWTRETAGSRSPRQELGVIPKAARNAAPKWLWLLNPQASAMSTNGSPAWSRSSDANSRSRRRYVVIVSPQPLVKARHSWNGVMSA